MLRGTIRYSCTFPRNLGPYAQATELVTNYGLESGPAEGTFDEGAAASLRESLLANPIFRTGLAANAEVDRAAAARPATRVLLRK